MDINDILNQDTQEVQSFKVASEKEKRFEELENARKKSGRPTKKTEEKAKKRSIYYTDKEYKKIEDLATIYGMTTTNFIKFCVNKELKKEEKSNQ